MWVLEKISKFGILVSICLIVLLRGSSLAANKFLVLCYHDIPLKVSDPFDVSQKMFMKQIEFLNTHGCSFISPDDILLAAKGVKPLPEKAVLLTFDDTYLSFYNFVYPILKMYGYPAVLSIVPSWIDKKTPDLEEKTLMSWDQIKEVADSDLVYLASHTYNLHRGIVYTAQGNIGPATDCFMWDTLRSGYETEEEFRIKIGKDLQESIKKIRDKTGITPWIVTWPYGKYNEITVREAKRLGFKMILTLNDGYASIYNLDEVNRNAITSEMSLHWFTSSFRTGFLEKESIRAVQVDLDLIVNPHSYEESDGNLGLLIERLLRLGVNTVFLQAFCDREGTGNIRSVYFANQILPVEMDFFGHAVHQIAIRGIQVYAWMPVLSFELPDKELNERLKVRECLNGNINITTSWYRRLSPFDKRTLSLVKSLYKDLVAHAKISGILFQDDAYLSDSEDFSPTAMKVYREKLGVEVTPKILAEDPALKARWTELKIEVLNQFIKELMKTVRRYRPTADYRPNVQFARNIYVRVITDPYAYEWFSQKLEAYLKDYDYTVIMAYPKMEGIRNEKGWFKEMVEKIKVHPEAIDKCIFKIQSYDWKTNTWIKEKKLKKGLRILVSSGAKHIAYYPDNVFADKPKIKHIVSITSAKFFPFEIKK